MRIIVISEITPPFGGYGPANEAVVGLAKNLETANDIVKRRLRFFDIPTDTMNFSHIGVIGNPHYAWYFEEMEVE